MPSDPSDISPTRPSPAAVSDVVRGAFAQPDTESILSALHRFELTVANNMEWPWMRWRLLADEDTAYLDGFPFEVPQAGGDALTHTLFAAALQVRGAGTDSAPLKNLFSDINELIENSKNLPLTLQLELMMLAYHERKWEAVHTLAARLIAEPAITGDTGLDARVKDLLLDTLFFSAYRPYMPYYVDNPVPLLEKLEGLLAQPSPAQLMAAGGMAAKTVSANLLAMRGQFDEALTLYGEVATSTGFRSPVFQQTQVLLPLESLTEETRADDLNWYHARSETAFHFTHAPAGEHALLVAVEPAYFKLYGALYAEIVGTSNPDALIHFHLINFDDKATAEAELSSLAKTAGVRINHTFEDNQMMAERPHLKGGVCVNTRYIYLPDYLEAYTGVTITDVDGWLLKSIADLTDFGERDSLVSSWIWKKNTGYWRLPWGNLSGGYCTIKSTANSRRFAALIAQYLTRLFARNAYVGKPLFYADQAAHFLCLQKAVADWGMQVGFVGGGFDQSPELGFGNRHEGKQQAMRDKLAALHAEAGNNQS